MPSAASARSLRHKSDASSSSAAMASDTTPKPRASMAADQPGPAAKAGARPASKSSNSTKSSGPPDQKRASNVKSKPASQPKAYVVVDTNLELLNGLRTDFKHLRSVLTCKICDRLLYEPYTTSCGHTYCYSCLCTWFINNQSRKTCPDCRAHIILQPAPAYLVREIAQTFVNRPEFLPEGETLEEHAKWQKDEAEAVQRDKNNTDLRTGGLFRGCFRHATVPPLRVIRDEQDNVDRCPRCAWELEEGLCPQCALEFDEDGYSVAGFTGFSDVDETSELDTDDLQIDAEIDDDNMDYDDYGFEVEHWLTTGGLVHSPMQRPMPNRPRRFLHSEAGSRGRPYSASLVSDLYSEDTEMGILEEEDEDEDSSMNDFIEDDGESDLISQSTNSSNSGATLQNRVEVGQRRRLISESTSPSVSGASQPEEEEEEDDDDEDEGPLPNGRRRRQAQLRARSAATPSSSRSTPFSEASGGVTQGSGFENARRVLLRQAWSPLDNESTHDEMVEDDYESDGARTTVGWEQTISNPRSREGGSLTPTADRPNGSVRRMGSSRVLDGSRGLRRRSSVVTVSTVSYEDGEADDDDSEFDGDGDVSMDGARLRSRQSNVRLRDGDVATRLQNRGQSLGDAIDVESDGSDESAYPAHRRRLPRIRQQEYDPRISYMFAEHQTVMREVDLQNSGTIYEQLGIEQLRSMTPIARPRTANRNRGVPQIGQAAGGPSSPANSRMRNASIDNFGLGSVPSSPNARTERSNSAASRRSSLAGNSGNNGVSLNRQPSVVSIGSNGGTIRRQPSNLRSPTHPPQSPLGFPDPYGVDDIIERPLSRVGSRPSSTTGRRNSGQMMGPYQSLLAASPGLNVAARNMTRNPFFVRSRPSSQRLREQPSSTTLRPRPSQRVIRVQPSVINVRDGAPVPQGLRSPVSRVNLRREPSQQRLHTQPSTQRMRQTGTAQAAPQQTQPAGRYPNGASRASSVTSGLSEDERQRRASELVRQRAQELGTNPFAATRRPSAARAGSIAGLAMSQADRRTTQTQAPPSSSGSSTGPSLSQSSATLPSSPPAGVPVVGQRRSSYVSAATSGAEALAQRNGSTSTIRLAPAQAAENRITQSPPSNRVVSSDLHPSAASIPQRA